MREEMEAQKAAGMQDESAAEGFALSPQQRRAWELARACGGSPFRVQCVVRLSGALDASALASAVSRAVARHEILRTTFVRPPGATAPVQRVGEDAAVEFPRFDLGGLAADEQARRIYAWLGEARPPAVEEDARLSPLRPALFSLGANEHALALALPALCADRASLDNLVAELARDYAGRAGDAGAAGPGVEDDDAEPLQYADITAWQNELAAAEESEPGRAYWREAVPGGTGATRLPWPGRRARLSEFDPRSTRRTFDADTSKRVEALAAAHATDARGVLLACWQLLLARIVLAPEVTVGVRFDGRKYEELQESDGPLARYLPVRCEVAAGQSFAALLARSNAVTESAARWQECFDWEHVGTFAAEEEGAPPYLPACFDFADEAATRTSAGVAFAPRERYECIEPFQVKLSCLRGDGGLTAELHYDASQMSDDDAARLAEEFETLLADALRDPSAAVSKLEVVGEAERRRLLYEFNDTRVELGARTTLQEMFEAQAARTPDAPAVVFEDDELTYAELNARANRLAHYLKGLGVGPDVPVGLLLERSPEMVVALLGVLKAGGAYVPLDPEYPRERLEFMAEDAGFPVLLTQARLVAQGAGGEPSSSGVRAARVFLLDAEWDAVAGHSEQNPSPSATPDNLAYVIYTSGSTGRPKGVMVTHAAISNRLLWMQGEYRLTADDAVLQKTPFSFDVSVWEFFWPLSSGARLVVARPGGHRDPGYLAGVIDRGGVTVLHFVPSMMRAFLADPASASCAGLRLVVSSGEALPPGLVTEFESRLGARLDNLYGPTEAAVDVSWWECRRGACAGRVPIGRPVANTRLYVLDAGLGLRPAGASGELYIGGVQLARGYLNRPALTAERFVPDPHGVEAGARLYRTGDEARQLPGGEIEYLGRGDGQVKVRGFRVEVGEVEAALGGLVGVRECAVVAREGAEGDTQLVAYVAWDGDEFDVGRLRAALSERLPEYMVPSRFVRLERLPLSPSGKIDRRALPAPGGAHVSHDFVAPRDEMERDLVSLWEEVLGVAPIGVRDNFFELGGHSVLALRVVGQIGRRFGKEVPLASMIQAKTIEGLAPLLRAEPTLLPWDPLVTIQPEGTRTPLFAVHSIGGQVFCYVALARALGRDQPCYGLQAPPLQDVGTASVKIEDMAAHYLNAMRAVQPAGPYQLCGYSFGVMVAFEIARQLRARGEEVALLALLDSPSPRYLHRLPPYEDDDAFMFALRGKTAAFERGRTIDMTRDEFDGLDYEAQLRHFHRRMTDEDLFPPEHDIEFLRNFMQGYRTRQKAVRFYHPDPYPGLVSLFRARETDPWMLEQFSKAGIDLTDPTAGWSELSTEPVDVYEVPGNHDRMCYDPQVRVLARRMREAMDKARGEVARGWAAKLLRRS